MSVTLLDATSNLCEIYFLQIENKLFDEKANDHDDNNVILMIVHF